MTNYLLEQDDDENENCEEPKGLKIEHLKAIMNNRDYLISAIVILWSIKFIE
jgi:hypothetical protein